MRALNFGVGLSFCCIFLYLSRFTLPLGACRCHAAIISRELGVPCVVGCGSATDDLKTGQVVTLDCSAGDRGVVLAGAVPFVVDKLDISVLPVTKTKVLLILANPDLAFDARSGVACDYVLFL